MQVGSDAHEPRLEGANRDGPLRPARCSARAARRLNQREPTADPLELRRGRAERHLAERLLVVGGRDARHRAYLGVAEPARAKKVVDARQPAERERDADPFARGPGREPEPPAQPVGARTRARDRPGAELVEAPHQREHPMGGGVEVRRERRELALDVVGLAGEILGEHATNILHARSAVNGKHTKQMLISLLDPLVGARQYAQILSCNVVRSRGRSLAPRCSHTRTRPLAGSPARGVPASWSDAMVGHFSRADPGQFARALKTSLDHRFLLRFMAHLLV